VAHICRFLDVNAQQGDVILTNYGREPIYFHTNLPQALAILPGDPVYEAARRMKLPDYVFGVDRAKWLIWRWPWEGYGGRRAEFVAVKNALEGRGGRLRRVASFRETMWENRPNLFLHRFPRRGYLFRGGRRADADAVVFEVEWPEESSP